LLDVEEVAERMNLAAGASLPAESRSNVADMTTTRRVVNGAKLRELYEDKLGLNRRRFAMASGVSESYLKRIEDGERNPSPVILAKLAAALDVDLNAFTTREPLDRAA
jgi:ribosome-binding protein aMBF1 (putative translation factor)